MLIYNIFIKNQISKIKFNKIIAWDLRNIDETPVECILYNQFI